MFSGAHHPFIYDKIPFQRAIAARTKDSEILEIDGKAQPPFQLWFAHAQHVTGKDKPIAKTQARALIASAVGGEISRLLRLGKDNRATLGSRPISPEDIAVLVRRNADARLMKHVLSQRNIPSVLYSTGNLFDTHEALEVERLLASIVEPSNEGLLKTALATDMMGAKGEDLEELMKDETRWEDRVIRHKAYHDLWRKKGFVQMFRRLLFDQNVIARLMALPDGERRATNVLHLSEVLHQASVQRKPGMAGLEKWLAEQRDPNAPRLEEHQLRLESDERSVKLVTIHKAKGLEYPVVFCPFAWDGSKIKNKKEPFTFHHKVDNMQLTLDMGSENMDRHRGWAEKEALAEQLRVLYVALTRARNRCYMIWGRFNEAETSAPAYLFHQPASCRPGDAARATAERFVGLSDEDMLEDLGALTSGARGTISVSAMPTGPNDGFTPSAAKRKVLGCRTFSGHIDRSWRITSFSSLTSRGYHNADLADRDSDIVATTDGQRLDVEPVADAVLWDIFAFPKGTKAGTFVHSIFENLDFAAADPSHVENLVAEKLSEYGYESKWQGVVCRMIRNVLAVPLDSGQGQFNLSSVTRKDRLTELAFYFPLRPTSAEALKRLLAARTTIDPEADRPERMGPLDFSPVKGFMKGYMDTVFRLDNRYYLVDWKTNFLGSQVEDYGPKALAAAMSKGFYVLQYLLYTVALHQYLRLRLPGYSYEKHFGGLYYLFVRGMDPDKGSHFGVFRDRPSEVLIDDLAEALIGVR
jgi:exodeoxyribonuclease V beta subunit